MSWGETLSLTHCGKCGKEEDWLYFSPDLPHVLELVEDVRNWFCWDCWEAAEAEIE